MKNAIQALFEVIMVILLAGVILHSCTSKEMWYAGSHDSQCEKVIDGSECRCYERFMNGR